MFNFTNFNTDTLVSLAQIFRRFTEPPPPVAALTAPASARVVKHEFRGLMQNSWNSAVSGLYTGALRESEKAGAWGWTLLYGGDAQARKDAVDEPRIE